MVNKRTISTDEWIGRARTDRQKLLLSIDGPLSQATVVVAAQTEKW